VSQLKLFNSCAGMLADVMDYATQIHCTHAVPKTSAAVGERISLAFRVKPEPPLD